MPLFKLGAKTPQVGDNAWVAPNATIAGFVSYGFNGYVTLQNAPDPQGDTFIDFYLAAMNQAADIGAPVVDAEVVRAV